LCYDKKEKCYRNKSQHPQLEKYCIADNTEKKRRMMNERRPSRNINECERNFEGNLLSSHNAPAIAAVTPKFVEKSPTKSIIAVGFTSKIIRNIEQRAK